MNIDKNEPQQNYITPEKSQKINKNRFLVTGVVALTVLIGGGALGAMFLSETAKPLAASVENTNIQTSFYDKVLNKIEQNREFTGFGESETEIDPLPLLEGQYEDCGEFVKKDTKYISDNCEIMIYGNCEDFTIYTNGNRNGKYSGAERYDRISHFVLDKTAEKYDLYE
jgi:hypothetical protein